MPTFTLLKRARDALLLPKDTSDTATAGVDSERCGFTEEEIREGAAQLAADPTTNVEELDDDE